jgi:tRNA-guanine family transglycosylase
VRARELTAARLLTLHNLTFMAELMKGIREAIVGGDYGGYAQRVLAGQAPY